MSELLGETICLLPHFTWYISCALSKKAWVCAFVQMLELALEVVSAWLGGPGEQSGHLCRWDYAESHG